MKAVAIFHHISQLEDELIMLDPTANLGRPKEYREHLLERRKGRIEFEENFRKIGAPLTRIPPAADNEQKNRLLKFAPHSKKILTLLIDPNFFAEGYEAENSKKAVGSILPTCRQESNPYTRY